MCESQKIPKKYLYIVEEYKMRSCKPWVIVAIFLLSVSGWAATPRRIAEALVAQKKYDLARQAFLVIAQNDPDTSVSTAARFWAARCLFEQSKLDQFTSETANLVQQYPQVQWDILANARYQLGRAAGMQQKWQAAAEKFGAMAAAHPESLLAPHALGYQADALRRLKNYDEARRVALQEFNHPQAKGDPALQISARRIAAECLFNKGDYEGFKNEANAILNQNPPASDGSVQLLKFNLANVPGKQNHSLDAARQMETFITENTSFSQRLLAEHRCGGYYMQAADQCARRGQNAQARAFAAKARTHFEEANKRLILRAAKNPASASSLHDRAMIIENFYAEHDYTNVIKLANAMANGATSSSLQWATGTTWLGIARMSMKPQDLDAAAQAFDAVLAVDVTDNNLDFHVPTMAAFWRATLAQQTKDDTALQAAITKIHQMPDGPVKDRALKRFAPAGAAQSGATAKLPDIPSE